MIENLSSKLSPSCTKENQKENLQFSTRTCHKQFLYKVKKQITKVKLFRKFTLTPKPQPLPPELKQKAGFPERRKSKHKRTCACSYLNANANWRVSLCPFTCMNWGNANASENARVSKFVRHVGIQGAQTRMRISR